MHKKDKSNIIEERQVTEVAADDDSWAFTVSYESSWDVDVPNWRNALAQVGHVLSHEIIDCLKEVGTLAPVHIDILLTTDDVVKELNFSYRDKESATNVLSFATWWDDDCPAPPAEGIPVMLGDMALALETIKREAKLDGKTVQAHFTHLAIHGILHLIGFDHMEDADAEHMEGLETRLLKALGISDPYAPLEVINEV